MSKSIILVEPILAQTPSQPQAGGSPPQQLWMIGSGVLFLLLAASIGYTVWNTNQLGKKVKFEEFKNRELQKKLKMALSTITKMEKNPDLIHSREFNLDYLRMRMAEENFHFAIVNQIKVKVKDKISVALRPTQETRGVGRQVDEVFDVEYETGEIEKMSKRVLFRIQIKLTKLPTQATSKTISQLIDCLETYLSPTEDHDTWQPTIQGRIAYIHWDQKAKPTPLLVLEQSDEGVNVTFRTNTRRTPATGQSPEGQMAAGGGNAASGRTATTTGRRGAANGDTSTTGGRSSTTGGRRTSAGRRSSTTGR